MNTNDTNTLIKDGLDARGAKHYGFLIPTIAQLIQDKVEKKKRAFDEEIKGLITDALIKRAVAQHTAEQKEKLNPQQQKELSYETSK